MKNISILPPEIKEQRKAQQRHAFYFRIGARVLVALFGVYIILLLLTMQANLTNRSLSDLRVSLEGEMQVYKQYDDLQVSVSRTNTLVRQAAGASPDWVQLMADINGHIPPSIWLTDLRASYGADPKAVAGAAAATAQPKGAGEFVVQGLAYDQSSVALWIEEMRQVSGLSDIRCQFLSEDKTDGKKLYKFEIKAVLQPASPGKTAPGKGD